MADQTQNIIINYELGDTSALDDSLTKLEKIGEVDNDTGIVFRKTNDAIKTRNLLLQQSLDSHKDLSASVTAEQAIYNKLVASVKNLTGESKKAVETLLKMSAGEVAEGFKEAAVNVDDYIQALEGAGGATGDLAKSTLTLRTQILQNKNALAEMTAAGLQGSAQFEQLSLETGKLQNSLTQTNLTVRRLASDSPLISAFGEGVTGLAGAFQAAAGASALFGDKNKDLQETLVKVTSVTAIAQGLQQAFNLVKKESAITAAAVVIQEKLSNAQKVIDIALTKESIVARTGARIAQLALNAATAAGPVGIIAAAIGLAVAGWVAYSSAMTDAAQKQKEFDEELAKTGALLDANVEAAKRAGSSQVAALEEVNARQSKILRSQAETQVDVIKQLTEARNAALDLAQQNASQLDDTEKKNFEDALKRSDELTDKIKTAETELSVIRAKGRKENTQEALQDTANLIDAQLALQLKSSNKSFDLQKKLARAKAAIDLEAAKDDADKTLDIQNRLFAQIKEISLAQAAARQETVAAGLQAAANKAAIQSKAINDRQSRAELDTQIAIINEAADYNKKTLIATEGQNTSKLLQIETDRQLKIQQLKQQFQTQDIINTLQDEVSKNNVILNQTGLTEKEKEKIKEDNIFLAADIEIAQNRGKNEKIKEIEAKRDADVRATRFAFLKSEFDQEMSFEKQKNEAILADIDRQLSAQDQILNATGIGGRKAVEKITGVQQMTFGQQSDLIQSGTDAQVEELNKQLSFHTRMNDAKLESDKDYANNVTAIEGELAKVYRDGDKKQVDLALKTREIKIAQVKAIADAAIQSAQIVFGLIQSIGEANDKAQQQRIDSERQNIQDLSDAGDISAKEAIVRNKKLDQEQKNLQREQAKRAKALALFNAVISTAQAIVAMLSAGIPGIVLAAIAAAAGAVQIALIASRPVPQFKGGKKKGGYEGIGVWGEAGAELMERNGRMYVADRPTVSYIEPGDIIYNPKESADLMKGKVGSGAIPAGARSGRPGQGFDYSKLGKTIAENTQQAGLLYENGAFREFIKQGNSFTKILNKRRKWD